MSTGGPYADRWHIGTAPRDPDQLADWLIERLGNLSRVLGIIQQRTEIAVATLEPAVLLSSNTVLSATSYTSLLTATVTPLVTGVARVLAVLSMNSGTTPGVQVNFQYFVNGVGQGVCQRSEVQSGSAAGQLFSASCHGEFPVVGGVKCTLDLQYQAQASGCTWIATGGAVSKSGLYVWLGVPSSSLAVK
jgi:hypothetical protein